MLGAPAGTAGEISREGHVGGAKKVSLFSSALHNQSFHIFSLTIAKNPKKLFYRRDFMEKFEFKICSQKSKFCLIF